MRGEGLTLINSFVRELQVFIAFIFFCYRKKPKRKSDKDLFAQSKKQQVKVPNQFPYLRVRGIIYGDSSMYGV